MPSVSQAQAHLMAAVAHGWHPSHMKHAPSQAVAKEFNQADKGRKIGKLAKHVKGKTRG